MTLDEVADQLYGLPPEQFTAARSAREKEARQGGDRELAASVHRLGKPTVAAWLANQLVRQRREALQALPDLGAELRGATERLDGEELRRLSRQQRELVSGLLEQARSIAEAAGQRMSEPVARAVEETLQAAVADEGACEQLFAGRLTDAMERSGFGWPASGGLVPIKRQSLKLNEAAPRRPRRDDEKVRAADQAVADAEQELCEATAVLDDAQTRSFDADEAAEGAAGEVERLRHELDEAVATAKAADHSRREQAKALQRAQKAVDGAEQSRAAAQADLDSLSASIGRRPGTEKPPRKG